MPKGSSEINIVCVDDSDNFAELIRDFLAEMEFRLEFDYVHIKDPAEVESYVAQNRSDVILLDYRLGSMTGLEVLEDLRDSGFEKPIVMLTAEGNERVAVKSLRGGADDYIPKNDLTIEKLRQAIKNALKEFLENRKQQQEQEELNKRLKNAMREDSITDLQNRRFFLKKFEQLFEDSHSQSYPLSLFILRISSLDVYSALHGPETFDKISGMTADTLNKNTGEAAINGRLKDEHFGVLMPEVPVSLARKRGQKIASELSKVYGELKEEENLTVEFGGVVTDRDPDDTNYVSMLKRAVREVISLELDPRGPVEMVG